MSITSDYWQLSETLMQTYLPIDVLIVSFISFFLILSLLYVGKKKAVGLALATLLIINSLAIWFVVNYTADYRALSVYESPMNRQIKVRVFGYEDITNRRSDTYTIADVKQAGKLPFYSLSESTDNRYSFLGKNDSFYFLESEGQLYRMNHTDENIQWSDASDKVVVHKEVAKLNQSSFVDIAFLKKVGPAISTVTLPKSMKDTHYETDIPVLDLY